MVRPAAALCELPGSVPRGHEERGCANYQTKVDIASLVADDKAVGRIKAQVVCGALNEPRQGFAAGTGFLGRVRAQIDGVQVHALA